MLYSNDAQHNIWHTGEALKKIKIKTPSPQILIDLISPVGIHILKTIPA